jgi:hypothetical protein
VAFVGNAVHYAERHLTAYSTQRGRIALYDDDRQPLDVFDSFDAMLASEGMKDAYPALVADVAEVLGEKYLPELDI